MIVLLTGTLREVLPTHVVLEVAHVGYELGVSTLTAQALPEVGTKDVTLYTRLVVREDALNLYGFATAEERSVFDHLIAISKVGPKLALSVLSTYTPAQLSQIVIAADTQAMAKVSGVGKKVAERLIIELKGVFAKDAQLKHLSADTSISQVQSANASSLQNVISDALLGMGFTDAEAQLAYQAVTEQNITDESQALAYALKQLGGRA